MAETVFRILLDGTSAGGTAPTSAPPAPGLPRPMAPPPSTPAPPGVGPAFSGQAPDMSRRGMPTSSMFDRPAQQAQAATPAGLGAAFAGPMPDASRRGMTVSTMFDQPVQQAQTPLVNATPATDASGRGPVSPPPDGPGGEIPTVELAENKPPPSQRQSQFAMLGRTLQAVAGGFGMGGKFAGMAQFLTMLGGGGDSSILANLTGNTASNLLTNALGGAAAAGGGAAAGAAEAGAKAAGGGAMSLESAMASSPVAIAMMAKKVFDKTLDGVASVVQSGSATAATALSGDNRSAVLSVMEGFANTVKQVDPIMGKLAETGTKVVGSLLMLSEAAVKRGEYLQRFNWDLAAANARRDVAMLGADIREANTLGPSLAKLTDAQTKFDTSLREALLPIKKALIEGLVPVMQYLSSRVQLVHELMIAMKESGSAYQEAIAQFASMGISGLPAIMASMENMPERIAQKIKDSKDKDLDTNVDAWWEKMFFALPPGNQAGVVPNIAQTPEVPMVRKVKDKGKK